MKTTLMLLALWLPLAHLAAQEQLSREDAVKFAAMVNFDLAKLADTPIPTDGDVKRPFGLKEGQHGALVVPETKLALSLLTNLGKETLPLGQLWLNKLSPARNGQAIATDQLKLVTIRYKEQERTLALCVLGAHKTAAGGLEVLLYGQGKEPLLLLPLKRVEGKQENPVEFAAVKEGDDGARVTLKILGQYEASFNVVGREE